MISCIQLPQVAMAKNKGFHDDFQYIQYNYKKHQENKHHLLVTIIQIIQLQ